MHKGFTKQYSTSTLDPSGENLCSNVPAVKIVMGLLEKEVERDRTF
jgi:hypothetical protein